MGSVRVTDNEVEAVLQDLLADPSVQAKLRMELCRLRLPDAAPEAQRAEGACHEGLYEWGGAADVMARAHRCFACVRRGGRGLAEAQGISCDARGVADEAEVTAVLQCRSRSWGCARMAGGEERRLCTANRRRVWESCRGGPLWQHARLNRRSLAVAMQGELQN